MNVRPTVHDLTAKICRHTHERNWEWRPSVLDTAQYVENAVCNCINARMGLESWCAHVGWLHRFNATDIFNHDLSKSSIQEEQKNDMREQWRVLCDLKSYIDQLHRKGHGGDLEKVWNGYTEPPYKSSVINLKIDDPLVALFGRVKDLYNDKIIDINYWALLWEIEDIVMRRKSALLSIVQAHTPKWATFVLPPPPVLSIDGDDSEL